MNPPTYTPERPCRCGYAGEGPHPCHAGRNMPPPCGQPSEPRYTICATMGSLAGSQMKVSAVLDWWHYCPACWAEIVAAPTISRAFVPAGERL